MNNKVVARFVDGQIIKGATSDFAPGKSFFHLMAVGAPRSSKPVKIEIRDLKAVFFVKDFSGNPKHQSRQEFDPTATPTGRKIKVVFKDGEVLVGTTQGYQPDRPGFFLVPADMSSNSERCYVVVEATKEVVLL